MQESGERKDQAVDGTGLNTAYTHGCVFQVRAKKGTTYTVVQRRIDAGTGQGDGRLSGERR